MRQTNDATCALCGRRLGARLEAQHLMPKTFGGRETVALHPICHRKIHTSLSERELRDRYHTVSARSLRDPRKRNRAEILQAKGGFPRERNTISELILRKSYHTFEALRADPDISLFLRWIANKRPDFHTRTETSRQRR
ncbi:hypothetical protein GJ654_14400 [Rhodoblastus acidophilus]|uniref:HNH endonuclease n=1 Tax=Rhodoblastus acidophilus TaxID=1074 RepID=A0A6N8DP47_RHOAC|nr:hypothetical protein [Rhodoblastus acidophilus]MCW2275211.1 hypothetical protein [Rhodoblastus acidophilus]MTV32177.1 hypothetical protein [Rhodoblastus acidophilus]